MTLSRWFAVVAGKISSLINPVKPSGSLTAQIDLLSEHNRQLQSQLEALQKVEHNLRESEAHLRMFSSVTSDYIFSTRLAPDGTVTNVQVNGALEEITGYTEQEFLALGGWSSIVHPEDRILDDRDMAILGSNQAIRTELRIVKKSGEVRWVRVYATPLWDAENNRLAGVYGGTRDITDYRESAQALRESEERFKALVANASDIITVLDADGNITLESPSITRILGYEVGMLLGKNVLDYMHPDDVERVTQVYLERLNDPGAQGTIDYRLRHADGSWVYLESRTTNMLHDPVIRGVVVNSRDITERVKAEEAVRASESRYRTLAENLPNSAIILYDRDLRFILVDGPEVYAAGYSKEMMEGKTLYEALPKQFADLAVENMQAVFRGERRSTVLPFENQFHKYHCEPLKNDQGEIAYGLILAQNITDQIRAQEALRESEARQRALLDASPDVAYLMSTEGAFLTVNKAVADLLNTTVEDMVGQNSFDILEPELQADRRPRFQEVLRTGKPIRFEDSGTFGWADNSIYPVLSPSGTVEAFAVYSRNITAQKRLEEQLQRYTDQLEQMVDDRTAELRHAKEQIELILDHTSDAVALAHPNGDVQLANPAFTSTFNEQVSRNIEHFLHLVVSEEHVDMLSHSLLNAIEDGQQQRVEIQIDTPDGNCRDIDLVLIPVRMIRGDSRWSVLISARDITQSKDFERFKTRFVSDALHDIATPITGLSTRLYLLRRSPEKLAEHTRALENQVDHLRNLLDDLRTLAHFGREQRPMEIDLGDVNAIMQRVFNTYEPVAISKEQTLIMSDDPQVPPIPIDIRLIERVIVNLVSNAINYSPPKTTIRISTCREQHHVVFRIEDQGYGISSDDLPHIFERFYRTADARRQRVQGTGLGLAIVKEAVEMHGGSVSVSSQLGAGTTFILRLPLSEITRAAIS